jgi:hypothetical protein
MWLYCIFRRIEKCSWFFSLVEKCRRCRLITKSIVELAAISKNQTSGRHLYFFLKNWLSDLFLAFSEITIYIIQSRRNHETKVIEKIEDPVYLSLFSVFILHRTMCRCIFLGVYIRTGVLCILQNQIHRNATPENNVRAGGAVMDTRTPTWCLDNIMIFMTLFKDFMTNKKN